MTSQFVGTSPQVSARFSGSFLSVLVSYQAVGIIVALLEAATITVGSAFGQLSYNEVLKTGSYDVAVMFGIGFLSSLLYVSLAQHFGLYRLPALIHPVKHLGRIAGVCAVVLLTLTAVLFLLKVSSDFSRGGIIGFAVSMMVSASLIRCLAAMAIDTMLSRKLIMGRPALLVGESDELETLSGSYLLRQFGLQDVGRVLVDREESYPGARRDQVADAAKLARLHAAREFVVAIRGDEREILSDIEQGLRKSPLRVRLMPNNVFRSAMGLRCAVSDASAHLIDIQRAPMGLGEQLAKRAVDIVLASFALAVLLPLFVIVACAIKMDSSGPVIFRQRRKGFNENQFVIFKFRTMSVQEDGSKIVQARRGDQRVTRVGQFLRRTSIDELPQFLNVLKGDMSIVGPRPHALAHDDEYKVLIDEYYRRHHVKPGITGWAQVNGYRGETSRTGEMQSRIECDVWYINNWSLLLDMRILFGTCVAVIKHDAY